MLFLTFSGVPATKLRLRKAHFSLLGIELLLLVLGLIYCIYSPLIGIGVVLLFMTPTATAAPSIVSLLGGDVGFVASSMLLAHGSIVILAPLLLPIISPSGATLPFVTQATEIFSSLTFLVLLPIGLAWGVRALRPALSERIAQQRQLPYFIWLSSLVLLMAHTQQLLLTDPHSWNWRDMSSCLAVGLVVCLLEFSLGHSLARPLGIERHAARQSLGQKNTTLALWLATFFLPPLIATVVAGYILWQNLFITLLMMRRCPPSS